PRLSCRVPARRRGSNAGAPARSAPPPIEKGRAHARLILRPAGGRSDPMDETARRLGGESGERELAPFQWAAVRYALEHRRCFLADEQGLGKTVEALATLEADDAFPAVVVCPASMKLTWAREAGRWLPHRSITIVNGRGGVPE